MRGKCFHPKPRGAKGKAVHVGSGHGLKAIIPPAVFWFCYSQTECPGNDLSSQTKLGGLSIKVKSTEMRQPETNLPQEPYKERMKVHAELVYILMTTAVENQTHSNSPSSPLPPLPLKHQEQLALCPPS